MTHSKRYYAVLALLLGCVTAAIVSNTQRIDNQHRLNMKSIEDRKGIHEELDALRDRVRQLEVRQAADALRRGEVVVIPNAWGPNWQEGK